MATRKLPSQPSKKAAKSQPRPRAPPGSGASISQCSFEYARALVDPKDGPLACVPKEPALNSRSERFHARGTFVCGTQGVGFAAARPCPIANAVASGHTSVFYTAIGYTGNTVDLVALATQVLTAEYNSSKISAGFGVPQMGGLQWRTVSHGLRVRYIGTNDSTNGTMIIAYPPDHETPHGKTASQILAVDNDRLYTRRVTKEWSSIHFTPIKDSETDYSWGTGTAPDLLTLGNTFAFCIVQGATGDTFEFETYEIIEFTGAAVAGTVTAPDSIGMSGAIGYASSARVSRKTTHTDKSVLNGIADFLKENTSAISTIASVGGAIVKAII